MSGLRRGVLALAVVAMMAGTAAPLDAAKVVRSKSSRALDRLVRPQGEIPTAAIYEVRSAVPGIEPRAATEMFMTALVRSGRFRVVERVRLNEGVGRERQLMASGVAAAVAGADQQVTGARYVFEVVISEGNPGEDKSDRSVQVGGLQLARKGNTDTIGMDIRITDVATGTVLDSVAVAEKVRSGTRQVSGLGWLADTALRRKGGRGLPVEADAQFASAHADGMDRALRNCIEVGVAELARRLSPQN